MWAGSAEHFVLEMVVRNTFQSVEYIPNLSEMLKFAWVQYVCLFFYLFCESKAKHLLSFVRGVSKQQLEPAFDATGQATDLAFLLCLTAPAMMCDSFASCPRTPCWA